MARRSIVGYRVVMVTLSVPELSPELLSLFARNNRPLELALLR